MEEIHNIFFWCLRSLPSITEKFDIYFTLSVSLSRCSLPLFQIPKLNLLLRYHFLLQFSLIDVSYAQRTQFHQWKLRKVLKLIKPSRIIDRLKNPRFRPFIVVYFLVELWFCFAFGVWVAVKACLAAIFCWVWDGRFCQIRNHQSRRKSLGKKKRGRLKR